MLFKNAFFPERGTPKSWNDYSNSHQIVVSHMLNLFFPSLSLFLFYGIQINVKGRNFIILVETWHALNSVLHERKVRRMSKGNIFFYRHLCAWLLLIWNFNAPLQLKFKLSFAIVCRFTYSSFAWCLIVAHQMLHNYYFLMYVDIKYCN